MSDYILNYSGAQLDEAINKVKNGYILPSGKPEPITKNGNDIDIAKYERIDVNVPIPALPTAEGASF